jgi:hypothetical protein
MAKQTWNAVYVAEEHMWHVGDGYETAAVVHRKENAQLVAAAPEMYAALKVMEDAYLHGSDSEFGNAIMEMRAALAKANGKSER